MVARIGLICELMVTQADPKKAVFARFDGFAKLGVDDSSLLKELLACELSSLGLV